jgi:hypothetical protein
MAEVSKPRIVLSWPAAKFRYVIGAALVAAETDTDLPHLCAVEVRRRNGILTVTGTDGRWVFRWREPEGMTDEEGQVTDRSAFQCVIPRRAAESFLAATKKPLELERVNLVGEKPPHWELTSILDVCKVEFSQVPEHFPDVDKVIPDVVQPSTHSIGVGADMVTRVAKAFAIATGESSTTIHWQFSGGPESPLMCTSATHAEILAVVMPRREKSDENAVPEAERVSP